MPSLMPGTPGAKEVYGISIIHPTYDIKIPPKACERYKISKNDTALLIQGRKNEPGFGLIKKETATQTVFTSYLERLEHINDLFFINGKACALIKINDFTIKTTPKIIVAFGLHISDRLLSIKSTTVTIGFSLLEIWIRKMKKHGFSQAIKNLDILDIF